MNRLNSQILAKRVGLLGVGFGLVGLVGCYVVPIEHSRYPAGNPTNQPQQPQQPQQSAPPSFVGFPARLYPANDLAIPYGMVLAQVTSDLSGRGTFSTVISGESFSGEATRTSSGTRSGIANGAGNRGSYIACRYQMNSATLGTGQCKLSNGAEFNMHVGG
jgi:hypothetical protein